jgi:UDPglucose 6-dehydrogenase
MRVGFVGLGKLGLPVALAAEAAGHEVHGWDVSEQVGQIIDTRTLPYVEAGAQELLDKTNIHFKQPYHLADWADIVFVAVQTLPRLLYNPFFIAMGTTIPDFQHPEFVLIGTDGAHPGPLREFYSKIHSKQLFVTTIKTAELTKVAYNTFIGLKIAFANTMMELCEKTGADVDDLVDALSLADKRLLSPAYLRGGMGDGGGCHPRDNIALSWLAREVGLSYDLFEALMVCRERQTEWLADLIVEEQNMTAEYRPIEILGKAYKPETALTVGSPATLLANILDEREVTYEHTDPIADI